MISTYLAFIATSVLLALTPGPDVLLVISTAGRLGFLPAFRLTLGFATGCLIHTCLLALGVTAVVVATPWAIDLVAVVGACYLLYLAWVTYKYRNKEADSTEQVEASFVRGVVMNVTNPKVLLFFFALFPQFAQLDQAGAGFRLLILGGIFALVTVLIFGALAWLTDKSLSQFFRKPRFKWWMDVVAMVLFFVLAMLLVFSLF